ncbi:hypothetical protein B0H10DRAFT_2046611 [Mycena sp. CBHHK59/15]|nr:hypothetical protein B0H10DRAFT_2046611 [Mycena sp. CBHHK59/15]
MVPVSGIQVYTGVRPDGGESYFIGSIAGRWSDIVVVSYRIRRCVSIPHGVETTRGAGRMHRRGV